jgi:hypothetical protein
MQVSIPDLEKQIKRYLASKFEEERITQVRKTTNWNISVSENLRRVMSPDGEEDPNVVEDVLDRLEDEPIIKKRYNISDDTKTLLTDFEDYMLYARRGGTNSKLRGDQPKDEDIRTNIVQTYVEELAKGYRKKVWGIPINARLSSLEDLWEALKNTRLHEIDSQDVEFSLSVMLRSYPSNVYSVWIYIAVFRDDMEALG